MRKKTTFGRATRLAIAALIGLLCVSAWAVKPAASDSKAKAKARYYYLKGAESSAMENYDEAYEFYKKAFKTDPTYLDAGYDYGAHRLILLDDTFSTPFEVERSLSVMKGLVDAYPRDITAGESYAYYAMEGDTLSEALRVYNILVKEHPGLSRLYYPQAFLYLNLGQTDSAINALRNYERLEGATAETTVRKVSYLISKGDTVGALREIDSYVESNPGNQKVLIDKAMIYNAMNLNDSAIIVLQNLLKEYPDNGDAKYDLGMLSIEKGDTAAFHQLVWEALTSDYFEYEDKVDGLRMYLSKLPSKGYDFKESDRIVESLNKEFPEDPALMELTASYNIAKGDRKAAFEAIKELFAQNPEDPALLVRYITFSALADNPRAGMKAYEDFKGEKDSYELLLSYISVAEMAKEYKKALAAAEEMLQNAVPTLSINDSTGAINPDSLKAQYPMDKLLVASAAFEVAGDIHTRLDNQADALRSYENALAIPVANPSVRNNYAYYLVETVKVAPGSPEFEKAKTLSRQSIDETPDNPQGNYFDTFGWILFKEHDYKVAVEYLDIAVELEGDDPPAEIVSHYGDALFMTGRPEEAIEQWKRALEIEPDNELLKRKVEHKTFFYE